MNGFSGIILFGKQNDEKLKSFHFPENIHGFYNRCHTFNTEAFRLQSYTNNKFERDGYFVYNAGCAIGFDGVNLLNQKLAENSDSVQFVNEIALIKGSFSAFHYSAEKNQVTLMADQTGSRHVFYYWSPSLFAFAPSILLLTSILKHFHVTYSISQPASYMMLTLGFLLEDYTLISEIKKVSAGKYVTAGKAGVEVKKYHDYYRKTEYNKITDELLEEIDARFTKSVILEYEKDRSYGYDHIATLSGGLDSRMNIMTARKNGHSDITCVTFSAGFKSDELTARMITEGQSFKHIVLLLNSGFQLYDIETPLILNNCSVYYYGAAHTLAAVKRINFSGYGLFHNGGLAESSKGSYLSGKQHHAPFFDKHFAISGKLFDRLENSLMENICSRYQNDEMLMTYSRGFNAAHNGSWMTLPFTSSVSTFMETNFSDLAYAIHPRLKHKGFFTVEWINKFDPEAAQYPWRWGFKPTNNRMRLLVPKIISRLKRELSGKEDNPVPISGWYKESANLRNFISSAFTTSPSWEVIPNQLKKDLDILFQGEMVEEKLLTISYLKSIELLFCR